MEFTRSAINKHNYHVHWATLTLFHDPTTDKRIVMYSCLFNLVIVCFYWCLSVLLWVLQLIQAASAIVAGTAFILHLLPTHHGVPTSAAVRTSVRGFFTSFTQSQSTVFISLVFSSSSSTLTLVVGPVRFHPPSLFLIYSPREIGISDKAPRTEVPKNRGCCG